MDHSLFERLREESEGRKKLLSELAPGSHIHLSAICGTGMGSVAALLKQLGFRITGSDKAFYPPMGDVVRGIADKLFEGYSGENLKPRPDFVIVGNNLSKTNPEVEAMLAEKIPFASMPEVFGAFLVGDRSYCGNSVVVAGTHGKTTTTAAISTMFDRAGRAPGYFIGGVPIDLPTAVRAPDLKRPAKERITVLEGDEYDSAYFAKWPKFLSYRPDILIVTSLEFDHADIYENVQEIEFEFTRAVSMVSKEGAVFASDHSPEMRTLQDAWRKSAQCEIISYGDNSSIRILERKPKPGGGQKLHLKLSKLELSFFSSIGGPQNAANILVAAAVGERLGLSEKEIIHGLEGFHGVLRRQTNHGDLGGVILIEDFAHHPTAVQLTLDGLRENYPGKRIVAAFEPRSNTTRRGFFQGEYPQSFRSSDVVLLLEVGEKNVYSNTESDVEPLDVQQMQNAVSALGKEAHYFPSVGELENWILSNTRSQDVVVCMSNGDFGGLMGRLKEKLKLR